MSFLKPVSLALLAAAISACSLQPAAQSAKAPELNNEDWYQVRTETQVFVFDDFAVFDQFLSSNQAPVLRKLEEKDPAGQEIILALRAEDQGKSLEQIAAYRFLKVSQVPAHPFYGEVRQDGKIFVFKRYGDMKDMIQLGEPTFRYTDIGGGPEGSTVTYALGKEEGRPDATIAQFKKKHLM